MERHRTSALAVTPANPIVLSPALLRSPLIDAQTLLVTPPWARWMQASWGRQGGAQAPSNAELDTGLASTNDSLGQTQDSLSQTQDDLSQTQEALSGTQEDLSQTQGDLARTQEALTATQAALAQTQADLTAAVERVSALEAHLAAIIAAVPGALTESTGGTATSTVDRVPDPAAQPATATVLRDDLVSSVWPTLRNNYADLTVQLNALRTALLAS